MVIVYVHQENIEIVRLSKQMTTICTLEEIHFKYNDIISLKVKEWIKICIKTLIQNNNNGSVTLISESIDFRRNITREEKKILHND